MSILHTPRGGEQLTGVANPRHPRFDRWVLALLHSPLHLLVDPGVCELRYRGRRSGARVRLPVLFARDDRRYVVIAGDGPAKQWWRNFRRPYPVEVGRAGHIHAGTGVLLRPGEPGYDQAHTAYLRRHRIQPQATDRLIVITLVDPAA